MRRLLAVLLLCGALAGCGSPVAKKFTRSVPDNRFLVGGGFDISYAAPTAGTVHLVDADSRRYLRTVTLTSGDVFEFSAVSGDSGQEGLEVLGIDIKTANLRLYFVPR